MSSRGNGDSELRFQEDGGAAPDVGGLTVLIHLWRVSMCGALC